MKPNNHHLENNNFSDGSADANKNLNRLTPLGIDPHREIRYFITWFIMAVLYSMVTLLKYRAYYNQLFIVTVPGQKVLDPRATMAPLNQILGTHMLGFVALAVAMIGVAVYHYIYHHQGSKSIYLMKRLPDKRELHRRCLSLPLMGMAVAIVTGLILLGIYIAVYFLVTPEQCLVPGQMATLLRIVF
ncbi:MAG: hypothetical protein IKV96_04280 [Firmicutes bacterium]|nr:hypothetical protein [Bacillota bacterium]